MTEEVPVEIASVLPDGQVQTQLRGPRAPLQEQLYRTRGFRYGVPLIVVTAILALLLVLRALRRRARHLVRLTAYDVAMERLRRLESRGLPTPEETDSFYVELSGVVRHYVEDRYHVRAPELTTEEFLREARRLAEMNQAHRELLGVFLDICDRVKFAGYRPEKDESQKALQESRRFLSETRLQESGKEKGRAAA